MNNQYIMNIKQLFILSGKKVLVGEAQGNINKKMFGKIYKNNIFVQYITILGEQMIKKTTPNMYRSIEIDGTLLFTNQDLFKDNWTLIIQ